MLIPRATHSILKAFTPLIQSFARSNMVAMYSTFVQSFLLLLVTLILVVFPADGLLGRGNLDTSYIDEERTLYIVSVFERDTARDLVYESSESVAQHIHVSLTVYFISYYG